MDDLERQAHLQALQTAAEGPQHSCELSERCRVQACLLGLAAGAPLVIGAWLLWANQAFAHSILVWGPALLFIAAGGAGLAIARALWRRHGCVVLALTPDTLAFANSPEPAQLYQFSEFVLEQSYLHTTLAFTVHAPKGAPPLSPRCYRSLAVPDAWPIAGGLQIKLWYVRLTLDGEPLKHRQVVQLIYSYVEAAQARHTLALLFPGVQRLGEVRHSTGQ
ncbi:hypothetical protein [Pseudomonas sp. KNUC1026]|uniref:hypothetical protein n=1 Tax=Pseudomonas sp. KNUC1026 TaxID=2893890 RepID=UPI001F476B1A|nr:hypothetical protein [Pseudomonas sp. KNUC1026]UFH49272.1 hypothetical protein LN139_20755 [Pseudomonas sp. KNUC1026]